MAHERAPSGRTSSAKTNLRRIESNQLNYQEVKFMARQRQKEIRRRRKRSAEAHKVSVKLAKAAKKSA